MNSVLKSFSFSFFILFFLILAPQYASAQKKQIQQARDIVKSGNNLGNAENMMNDLLKDSTNRKNEKIWITLFESLKKQYDQGNEKLYLKQQYDTAALFNTTRKMFLAMESFDSIDAQPDKRGKIKLKYRKDNASLLTKLRPNLYNGGAYFIKKNNLKSAFDFFDTYINCAVQPLFSAYNYAEKDSLLAKAAYWSMFCGYKQKDAAMTLKYDSIAKKNIRKLPLVLQYEAQALLINKDSVGYVKALKAGFEKFPTFPYFFPRLVDYYTNHECLDSAIVVTDRALATDSTNILYRFAKSNLLLNTGHYNECIAISKKIIAVDDSIPDTYYNIGLAYFNQALELEKSGERTAAMRKKLNNLYTKSRPYMERYRAFAPDQKDKWGMILYTIYLNLNMGKEFDEIDKLMKQ